VNSNKEMLMHTILITLFLVLSSGQPAKEPLGTLAVQEVAVAGSEVKLTLTPDSAKSLATITRAHVGDKVAIFVGGAVQSTPVIRDPIVNGKVSVTLRTPDDAAALARSLK
jgi:preprotein translocase subunit SecD